MTTVRKNHKQTKKCPLDHLSFQGLSNPFPGIRFAKNRPELEKHLFTCCGGQGMFFLQDENCMVQCQLRSRLTKLQDFVEKFEQRWKDQSFPRTMSLEAETKAKRWMVDFLSNRETKGFCLSRKHTIPSMLWAIGGMAIWRFNIDIIWINLGLEDLPSILKQITASKRTSLCFIEQEEHMWKHHEALECIVSWCENAGFPLWIDFLRQPSAPNVSKLASLSPFHEQLRLQVSTHIETTHNRLPLYWVDDFCKSRLRTICHNSDLFCQ